MGRAIGGSRGLLGLESQTIPRGGFVPADGRVSGPWDAVPAVRTKTRPRHQRRQRQPPLIVLANLSGFDGFARVHAQRQLEYGAEIGRAVTNFRGPIVFVVSRGTTAVLSSCSPSD